MNDNLVNDRAKTKATLVLKVLDNLGKDWISTEMVADYLDSGRSTVYKLINDGELETARVAPKKILVSVSSLRAFLERRKNLGVDSRFAPKHWNGGRREGNQYTD